MTERDYPGDASADTPSSTPGPGRTRVVLPWVVIGIGAACWAVALVLGVVSVVNWVTAP